MRDQASALRQMVDNLKKQRVRETKKTSSCRVMCVSSGKGGVGKTSISINLSISLAQKGMRVLVIDADFGLSNVDVMLGISSKYDLSHVMRGQKLIQDAIAEGPGGIRFISGGSGMNELLNMSEDQLGFILDKLVVLDEIADIIIFDTGAGISPLIMRMIRASAEALIVATPEPTAIMDAYALVKSVAKEASDCELRLIINRAESVAEAEMTLEKFISAARLYQKIEIDRLGYVLNDPSVSRAVRLQQPFTLSYPKSTAARNIENITWNLLDRKPNQESGGLGSFFSRLFRK